MRFVNHLLIVLGAAALAVSLMGALPGCQFVKDAGRTINDAATIMCETFGAEDPEGFKAMALELLPDGAHDQAEADGFNPKILCALHEVIAPFIDSALSARSMAVGKTMGGEAPEDPGVDEPERPPASVCPAPAEPAPVPQEPASGPQAAPQAE